jgi:hypothetical protein
MWLKGAFVVCCLLVFLAVVHCEAERGEAAAVEGSEDHELDRETRDLKDAETSVDEYEDEDVAVDEEKATVEREKRHRTST